MNRTHDKSSKKETTFSYRGTIKSAKAANTLQLVDNRTRTSQEKKMNSMLNRTGQGNYIPLQLKKNDTGLPERLKAGVENLSGFAMDDVKVHYNSDKPSQLNAHAYAQGTQIHLAPGQEKHLPHEAWHVVQQKQGRVKPTFQLKGKININNDAGLEKEANEMGDLAISEKLLLKKEASEKIKLSNSNWSIVQRFEYSSEAEEDNSDDMPEDSEMLQSRIDRLIEIEESSEVEAEEVDSIVESQQLNLASNLQNWRVHANLIFKHGTGDHIINSDLLEDTLRILILRGDRISLNTADFIMRSNNYRVTQLIIRQMNLDPGTDARASREGTGFRIAVRNNWYDPNSIATVLVHEVNHIRNEVADIDNFQGHPVEQFLTEFRAYLVAGNWPVNWDLSISNEVVAILEYAGNEILRDAICISAGIGNLSAYSILEQCQFAFLYVREHVLQSGGTGVEDLPGETTIRKLLANHLMKHIHNDYPKSHTFNQTNERQEQIDIATNFAYQGILPGNISNE